MNDYDAPRQNLRCTLTPAELGYSANEMVRAMSTVAAAMPSVLDLPPLDVLPPRFAMRAPLVKRHLSVRPVAVIEAEIRRAVTPALRPEDC